MFRTLALALTTMTLAGCGVDDAQLVEADLINASASKVTACFGKPDRKLRVGIEQVWVYDVGHLRAQGWLPALGADEHPLFSAPTPDCQVRFTVDSHGVRGVRYTDSAGLALPQAEVCDTQVRACLEGPAS